MVAADIPRSIAKNKMTTIRANILIVRAFPVAICHGKNQYTQFPEVHRCCIFQPAFLSQTTCNFIDYLQLCICRLQISWYCIYMSS